MLPGWLRTLLTGRELVYDVNHDTWDAATDGVRVFITRHYPKGSNVQVKVRITQQVPHGPAHARVWVSP